MAAHYLNPHRLPLDQSPPMAPRRPPVEGEAEAVAIVPFVPWRCPSCGDSKPRTYSQRGRVRYHQCQACQLRYRSIEISAADLAEHPLLRDPQ